MVNSLQLFEQAMHALQRNIKALGLYLGITVVVSQIRLLVEYVYLEPAKDTLDPVYLNVWTIGTIVYLSLFYAVAQSLAFSKIGAEMDRPLWKITGTKEPLRRFFLFWFLLNLITTAIYQLSTSMLEHNTENALFQLLFFLSVAILLISTPVGAAVMFTGRAERGTFKEAMTPLFRFMPQTLVLFMFNGMIFFLVMYYFWLTQEIKWILPAVDVISGYFDCIAFAFAWQLCITHRNIPEDAEDEDDIY